MTTQPTQDAIVTQRAEPFERLKYYPDYIDDAEGLERLRQDVRSSSGHDMAHINYNSLGRLIDTIERLRHDRAEIEAATIERCAAHFQAMHDAQPSMENYCFMTYDCIAEDLRNLKGQTS